MSVSVAYECLRNIAHVTYGRGLINPPLTTLRYVILPVLKITSYTGWAKKRTACFQTL